MKRLLALLFLFICLANAFAFSPEAQFQKGIKAYDSSNYSQAIIHFEKIIEQGHISSDLYYNIGNAYYQQNDIAKAILFYERALKIDPKHEDAQFNLKIANTKTIDKVEQIPELFIYRWFKKITLSNSIKSWAIWSNILLLLGSLGLALYFLSDQIKLRKIGFYLAIALLFGSICSWYFAKKQNNWLAREDAAIIIEPTVSIYSSPSPGSSKLFVLHEGTKVKLLNSSNDWREISLPNGNKGWIHENLIESI